MKNIKKFGQNIMIGAFIGIAMMIFAREVIGPAFDLERLEANIIGVVLAIIVAITFEFIKARKKK